MIEITENQAQILSKIMEYSNIAGRVVAHCNNFMLTTAFFQYEWKKRGLVNNQSEDPFSQFLTPAGKDIPMSVIYELTRDITKGTPAPRDTNEEAKKEIKLLEGIFFLDDRYCNYELEKIRNFSNTVKGEFIDKELVSTLPNPIQMKGMSATAIGKIGNINKRTFLNNCEFLISRYLIKIASEETHGIVQDKWKFYTVTPFGRLVLLKWTIKNMKGFQDPSGKPTLPWVFDEKIALFRKNLPELDDTEFLIILIDSLENLDFFPRAVVSDSETNKIICTSNELYVKYTIPTSTNSEIILKEDYSFSEINFHWDINFLKQDPKTKKNFVEKTETEKVKDKIPDDIFDILEFMVYWNAIMTHIYPYSERESRKISSKLLGDDFNPANPIPTLELYFRKIEKIAQNTAGIGSRAKKNPKDVFLEKSLDHFLKQDKRTKKLLKRFQNDPHISALFKKQIKKIKYASGPLTKELLSAFN